jgi:hypothetical protein
MSFGWFFRLCQWNREEKEKEEMTTRERKRMSCVCTQQLRPFGQEIRQESRGFSSLDPSKSSLSPLAVYTIHILYGPIQQK